MSGFRNLLIATLPLGVLLSGCGKESSPHVVLVTLDTLRADFLGCYGNDWVETPNLDAFAAGGARFEQATCQIPATLTSHTCILSSLYPRTSGVRFGSFLVPDELTTLPEILKGEGYQTAAFVSALVLEKKYNLDQGFDLYDDGPLHPVERPATEVNEKIFDWLDTGRDPEKPVFLWAHYYDAHSPYEPPAPWDKKYDPDYEGPLTGSSSNLTQLIAARGVGATQRDLRHLHALYAGEVSALDEQLGKLLDRLSEKLGPENTIVAILSDHGESLGERNKFFHGEDLYAPAMNIPFLVSWPGRIEPGKTIGELAHTLDVAPTILGLLGIPPMPEAEGDDLSVRLLGAPPEEQRNLVAFLETEEPYIQEGDKVLGARSDKYKFIHNRAHRRPPVLYGRLINRPLDRNMFGQVFVKDASYALISAHIRYHPNQDSLKLGNEAPNLRDIPTTFVDAAPFGSDPLHARALKEGGLKQPNPGWRPIVTPNLFERAREYGETMEFPTEWMAVESLMVDLAAPWTEDTNEATLDNLELVVYQAGPERPDWTTEVFADLETGKASDSLIESATGPSRSSRREWVQDTAFPGSLNLSVRITVDFQRFPEHERLDEVYDLTVDPLETRNLFKTSPASGEVGAPDVADLRDSFVDRIEAWARGTPAYEAGAAELSAEDREKLESIGYNR